MNRYSSKSMSFPQFLFKKAFCKNVIVFIASVFFCVPNHVSASEITAEKVIELVNKDRSSVQAGLLQSNQALTDAAEAKANDMLAHDYFAHISPDGATPWHWIKRSGYVYRVAGENLAVHFSNAEEQEKAWMESVKHRENILNPRYRDIGVSVKKSFSNGEPIILVVQMFGLSASARPLNETSNVSLKKDGKEQVSSDKKSEDLLFGLKYQGNVKEISSGTVLTKAIDERSIFSKGYAAALAMTIVGLFGNIIEVVQMMRRTVFFKRRERRFGMNNILFATK